MRELKDELGLSGHVVMTKVKTKAEWLKQARNSMSRAEKYGATTPNTMNEKDRNDLREALKGLGQKPDF